MSFKMPIISWRKLSGFNTMMFLPYHSNSCRKSRRGLTARVCGFSPPAHFPSDRYRSNLHNNSLESGTSSSLPATDVSRKSSSGNWCGRKENNRKREKIAHEMHYISSIDKPLYSMLYFLNFPVTWKKCSAFSFTIPITTSLAWRLTS